MQRGEGESWRRDRSDSMTGQSVGEGCAEQGGEVQLSCQGLYSGAWRLDYRHCTRKVTLSFLTCIFSF